MGLRVLVVEDEMTIAMMIEDMLVELGHTVVQLAMRLAPAIEAAGAAELDFAILDVNLDGENSAPVGEVLRRRGVPFAFATGYGVSGLPDAFRDQPVLPKPFMLDDLARLLASMDPGG